ncbi:MAG: hypothetical protein AAFR59_18970, partial [Bacteroidota bacterium]
MILSSRFKESLTYFVYLFAGGFILTFSFPFIYIPDWGGMLNVCFEPINQLWAQLFSIGEGAYLRIQSDTTGQYLHLLTLGIGAGIGATVMLSARFSLPHRHFRTFFTYYLAFILLRYGFDKMFLSQFPFPSPNLLYARLESLNPDILYWSAVGTSPTYA